MSKQVSVFIARVQPLHLGHLEIIKEALKTSDQVILAIGSHRAPLSLKNPWTFEERKLMVMECLDRSAYGKLSILPLRDYFYNEINWVVALQNVVRQEVSDSDAKVSLRGHFKDDSSYYLNSFPQWQLVREPNYFGANSRDIRHDYFGNGGWINKSILHPNTQEYLRQFKLTERYANLCTEHQFVKDYKEQWSASPYPPTFVTTDSVVMASGHVLLIRRGRNPGKGCLALPGGFVKQDKSVLDSALEELKEETNVLLARDRIKAALKKQRVFDHPNRDTRGRTITHGFYFNLGDQGELPHVLGGDDASTALWVPLADLSQLEDQFYSDHLHIINSFIYDSQ